jgi:hypothetical protein
MTTKIKRQHYSQVSGQEWDTTHFKYYVLDQQMHENKVNPKNPKLFTFDQLFTFVDLPAEKAEKFQKTYNNLVKNNWVYWNFQK